MCSHTYITLNGLNVAFKVFVAHEILWHLILVFPIILFWGEHLVFQRPIGSVFTTWKIT